MIPKKGLLVLHLIFIFELASAQSYQRYQVIFAPSATQYIPVSAENAKDFFAKNNIDKQTIIKTAVTKKGKKKTSKVHQTFVFTKQGKVAEYYTSLNGKLMQKCEYTYDSFGNVILKLNWDKKGRLVNKETYYKKPKGAGSEYCRINKKGDTTFRVERSAIDRGSFTSVDSYFKRGKLEYVWKNDYYPDKNLRKTILYTKKGKQKYVWDYQCKKEGVEIVKHKDTTAVCESVEKDSNGITTNIRQFVDEKGEINKSVLKTNRYGKYWYYKTTKGPGDVTTYEQIITYGSDDSTVVKQQTIWYTKGKTVTKSIVEYDENGNQQLYRKDGYKNDNHISASSIQFVYNNEKKPVLKTEVDEIQKTHIEYAIFYD